MTPEEQARREVADRAAEQAAAAVAASYLLETSGRPLSRHQHDLRVKAERLARWLQRQAEREARP